MGNQPAPTTGGKLNKQDTGYYSNQKSPENQFKAILEESFKKAANNGNIYRNKFNEALSCLEKFNIKRLRDTPLGLRLFDLFDDDRNNCISFAEFENGLTKLLNDKESRISFTFDAIDKDNDNKISFNEFFDFIEESWLVAFRLLGERMQKQLFSPSGHVQKVNLWAQSKIPDLRKEISTIFTQMDPGRCEYATKDAYRQWIINSNCHSIMAVYENMIVEVPIDLYKIDTNYSR